MEVEPLDVLATLEREEKKFPSIKVDREDNIKYDLGRLAAFDPIGLDVRQLQQDPTDYLQSYGRDVVQLFINQLFDLPSKRDEDGVSCTLPPPITKLPREKPVPKPKALTKWAKFAIESGIKKKKKENLEWDEINKRWVPRYGYKSKKGTEDEWLIDAKPNDELGKDPWINAREEKRERVKKQKERQEKNIKNAQKDNIRKLPATIAISHTEAAKSGPIQRHKADVLNALSKAQTSTISMGKFDRKLDGEKPLKKRKKIMSQSEEKDKTLKVIDRIVNKRDKIDLNKAVTSTIKRQQMNKSRRPKGPQAKRQKS